ncbi:DUF7079 family protein [Modicisalibacter xianhensis]|uniref:DUF7079 domain-containing protein n=1 Tax=Modicisalibacter xianhensis TaxID=442341 RepID=A0A1I2YU78_9GAMM|nr:hypothetical protein [Halomonas xianhensis]TDX31576.1 hypothetical protein DFO67_103174 [Halomonas xianhensis]SFH28656.1 hypothetical protein SAMN04487959_102131 [Halomonas xianhensis]
MEEIETLVAKRGELWLALAPLWLDREPRESDYQHMIEVIGRHDLTLEQLEWIFRLELAPVLSRQQMSMAGEWRSFDENRLLTRLVIHYRRLSGWRKGFWTLFSGLTTMMTRHRWNLLMTRLMEERGETPS